jgi:hypothetical protein
MNLPAVFENFMRESPVSVMFQGLLENALAARDMDGICFRTARRQYFRRILFSSLVDLMCLVVMKTKPSLRAAYQTRRDRMQARISSVYRKFNGIEPAVSAALVRHIAGRLGAILNEMQAELPSRFPGYTVKILDGNHLPGTEHRIRELRTTNSGALPGQALVILDPQKMLITDVFPWEDAHDQERTILPQVLQRVQPGELYLDDRNFCTTGFLFGVHRRGAFFLTRQHASTLHGELLEERKYVGKTATGVVWETRVRLTDPEGKAFPDHGELIVRRITVELFQPTRNGDHAVHLLTDLPDLIGALALADGYLDRWTIERAFNELVSTLHNEIDTLGYPPAALFGFCVGLVLYNVMSLVKAALRVVHGREKIATDVSSYYLAEDVSSTWRGMMIAIGEPNWAEAFGDLRPKPLADLLVTLAGKVDLLRFQKHPRGPKKDPPKRSSGKRQKHVATARLLAQRKQRARSPPC